MYQAIYKCRLCKKKYSFNIEKEANEAFDAHPFRNEDCATIPGNVILHNCRKGKIGAADIQGFKKVGE